MFDEAAKDIEDILVQKSAGGLTYIAMSKNGRLEHKMEHLACFAGGMYGLAAVEEEDANSARWLQLGEPCPWWWLGVGFGSPLGSPGGWVLVGGIPKANIVFYRFCS